MIIRYVDPQGNYAIKNPKSPVLIIKAPMLGA